MVTTIIATPQLPTYWYTKDSNQNIGCERNGQPAVVDRELEAIMQFAELGLQLRSNEYSSPESVVFARLYCLFCTDDARDHRVIADFDAEDCAVAPARER